MSSLDALATGVRAAFERVHRDAFLGDPVANSRLTVDVVDAAVVADTPVLVLVTPWTMNGLAFPPDDVFPQVVELAGRARPVARIGMPGVPAFRSIVLPSQTESLRDMPRARNLARSWIAPLHEAVRTARAATTSQPADGYGQR